MLRRMSLGAKLILGLGLTVAVAVASMAVLANAAAKRHFEDYVSAEMRPRVAAMAPDLEDFYDENESWDDVAVVFSTAGPGYGQRGRAGAGAGNTPMMLADTTGQIIYSTADEDVGKRLAESILERGLPIIEDDQVVGYLLTGSGPHEQDFGAALYQSLLGAGLLAAIAAVIIGMLLTRTTLQPLRSVSEATQQIEKGDLSYRAQVTTQDEIGQLALRFNTMAAQLEKNEYLRRRLVADISHELRNPLAGILGQIEAIQDGIFELDQENLKPIHSQVLLLQRIIEDLRTLALSEAGQLQMERSEVDLNDLIQRVADAYQHAAHEASVVLEVSSTPAQLIAEGDPQRLAQSIGNLVSNAIRYTPGGGHVRLSAQREGAELVIRVSDTGQGIAEEDLPLVFERFYRTDTARSRAEGGTGLGLAIARQFVDAHGGTLSVTSELGQGSVFIIRLPVLSPSTSASKGLG